MINTYIVQPNETISDIVKKFNYTIDDFKQVNDTDLNNLSVGQVINIPDKPDNGFVFYQVRNGDTLTELAKKTGLSLKKFSLMNGLSEDDYLYIGQILLIPKPGIKVYITEEAETLDDVSKKIGVPVTNLLNNNKNIYLLKEQLLLYK